MKDAIGVINLLRPYDAKPYTPDQFLVIDKDQKFLDACHSKGVTTVRVGKELWYTYPRKHEIPSLGFLTHVIRTVDTLNWLDDKSEYPLL